MKNTKILIIDDDIDTINIYKAILEKENYQVFNASNKNEGIKIANEQLPDLIVLDVMMTTHYEGFELKQELDKNIKLNTIPVIFQTSIDLLTTSDAQKESIQEMARAFRNDPKYKELQVLLIKNLTNGLNGVDYLNEDGKNVYFEVDGFLRKPVKGDELLAEIRRLIKKVA